LSYWTLTRHTEHTARKEHTCSGCHHTILPGQTYTRLEGLYDGEWTTWKDCGRCVPCMEKTLTTPATLCPRCRGTGRFRVPEFHCNRCDGDSYVYSTDIRHVNGPATPPVSRGVGSATCQAKSKTKSRSTSTRICPGGHTSPGGPGRRATRSAMDPRSRRKQPRRPSTTWKSRSTTGKSTTSLTSQSCVNHNWTTGETPMKAYEVTQTSIDMTLTNDDGEYIDPPLGGYVLVADARILVFTKTEELVGVSEEYKDPHQWCVDWGSHLKKITGGVNGSER